MFLLGTSAFPKSLLLLVTGTAAPHTAWHLQLKVFVSWKGWLLVCGAYSTLTGRLGDTVTQAQRSPGGQREGCQGLEAQP